MSDVDEEECPECEAGIPAWVMTFADLMSLLMCFFVLLLSFSEMDALKFKRLAGSMAQAFGVQNIVNVNDIPRGTSIIAREFSPAIPEPTPLNEIRQSTTELTESSLDVQKNEQADVEQGDVGERDGVKIEIAQKIQDLIEQTQSDAMELADAMRIQIVRGEIEVETEGRKIIIRIKEKGSFEPGTGVLSPAFRAVLGNIREVIASQEGVISVEGHTDNINISTSRYRSNWDLSVIRASTVAQELFINNVLDQRRFSVTGFADTRPLVSNTTAENRAENRRVEIVIRQGLDLDILDEIEALQGADAELFRSLRLAEGNTLFNPPPRELF